MNKQDKLIARFNNCPSDLTWDEFVKVFSIYGFTMSCGQGSRRRFYNADNVVFYAHEPHPRNIVKQYAIRQAINFLNSLHEQGERDV